MFRSILQRSSIRQVQRITTKPNVIPVRRPYSTAKPHGSGTPSIPAMLAVASMGLPRKQDNTTEEKPATTSEPETKIVQQDKAVPAFSPDEVTVVFVLGGPGVGKGTQCDRIKKDYDFVHLSAGDLLREEQSREGSKYGELIKHYIKEGLIVPMEVTIALLEQAMREHMEKNNKSRFLIDGFPRKMDQAIKFEESVVPSKLVLYFECPEQVMLERLLKRSESSGRADDNIESIKKRFRVFKETSFPVIAAYEKQDKVKTVSCENTVDAVYKEVQSVFDKIVQ
ncbi:unnamed protein product [Cunninghamella blakesleeana]